MTSTPPDRAYARLDVAIGKFRRFWNRPALRERFFAHLDRPVDVGSLRTLRAISSAPGKEVSVGDVAASLEVEHSTACRLVDRCVLEGYVDRAASLTDGRRKVLRLTDEGRTLLDDSNAARIALLREVTRDWDRADVERLATLLDRLHDDVVADLGAELGAGA